MKEEGKKETHIYFRRLARLLGELEDLGLAHLHSNTPFLVDALAQIEPHQSALQTGVEQAREACLAISKITDLQGEPRETESRNPRPRPRRQRVRKRLETASRQQWLDFAGEDGKV